MSRSRLLEILVTIDQCTYANADWDTVEGKKVRSARRGRDDDSQHDDARHDRSEYSSGVLDVVTARSLFMDHSTGKVLDLYRSKTI